MFLSWCFLLCLASYGLSPTQSHHVALGDEGYWGGRQDAYNDYGPQAAVGYGSDTEGSEVGHSVKTEVEHRKYVFGVTRFMMGGIGALVDLLPDYTAAQKRNGGPVIMRRKPANSTEVNAKLDEVKQALDEFAALMDV